MYSNIDAKVVLSKCQEGKKVFGVRMEKTSQGWKYNWAFKVSDNRANAEHYGATKIVGDIYPDPSYPGCPYCRGRYFVVCGSCGKLNCDNSNEKIFTCKWCGVQGELSAYDGAGINSSNDV